MSTEITRFLQRVERGNLAFGAVVVLVSALVLGFGHALLSMAMGFVLGALNFRVIAWIGRKVMRASPTSRTLFFLLFVAKFGVLIALTYVLVVRVRVDVLPFIVGLSTLFVTLTFESYRTALKQGRPQAAGSDSPPANRE